MSTPDVDCHEPLPEESCKCIECGAPTKGFEDIHDRLTGRHKAFRPLCTICRGLKNMAEGVGELAPARELAGTPLFSGWAARVAQLKAQAAARQVEPEPDPEPASSDPLLDPIDQALKHNADFMASGPSQT